jgi:hypothetical protein
VHGVDDLVTVDPLEVGRSHAEVGVTAVVLAGGVLRRWMMADA